MTRSVLRFVFGGGNMGQKIDKERIVHDLVVWGCDVSGALGRFVGNDDLFFQLLFIVPEQEAFASIGTALKNKDAKTAFAKSHEIKGVLANMGLTPLCNDAANLVEPLRAGKLVRADEHYAKLMDDLAHLRNILKG